jgi:general stress protein YciG
MRFEGERARAAGASGGHITRETHGQAFMKDIGRKGGNTTKTKGKEFYAEIGRKGMASRKAAARLEVLREVEQMVLAIEEAQGVRLRPDGLDVLMKWLAEEMARARPEGR